MRDLTEYEKVRAYIGSGDIISWQTHSLLGSAIRFFSPRPIGMLKGINPNHVATVFVDTLEDKLALRNQIIEAYDGEVNARLLSRRLSDFDGKVYWHQLVPELDKYRDDITDSIKEHIGERYGYGTLIKFAITRPSVDPRDWICSEISQHGIVNAVPRSVIESFLPDPFVKLVLDGKILKPSEEIQLPFWTFKAEIL